jgi:dienelactone hydrolase
MDRMAAHRRSHRRSPRSCRGAVAAVIAIIAVIVIAAVLMLQPKKGDGGENAPPPADPNAVQVTFGTEDGWQLKGTFYRGSPSAPLVIMVHGLNEARGYWGDSIISELRAKGLNILAFDSRGHGESIKVNGVKRDWKAFSEDEFPKMTLDINAAKQYAYANFPFAPRIAVVGASIGANEALAFAASANGTEVRTVVLLSPGTDYRGIESGPPAQALGLRGGVALFIAAGEADSGALPCSRSLNETYPGTKRLLTQSGGAHGTVLLTYDGIRREIVDFILANTSG